VDVRTRLGALPGTDLIAWLAQPGGEPVVRRGAGSPVAGDSRVEAVVETVRGELRFRPGRAGKLDRRGQRWHVDGDLEALALNVDGASIDSREYPDALGRLWSALVAPHSGDVIVSLAEGYECVVWVQTSHIGGGSHGSLLAGDSLAPLLLVGFEPGTEASRDQWRITDVAALVRGHFGLQDEYEMEWPRSEAGASA